MDGFFHLSVLKQDQKFASRIPQCGACGLYKHCKSPKMKVFGDGAKKILICGEAPGEQEDDQGRPFIGASGEHLRKALLRLGCKMDRDCWLTNACVCRPKNNKKPDDKKIGYCRPNLVKTIDELDPNIIILLGGSAVKSFVGIVWSERVDKVRRWTGWKIPCQKPNVWVLPTWHPSYLLRLKNEVNNRFFSDHLKMALECKGKPWKDVPKYKERVKLLYKQEEVEKAIDEIITAGKMIAFDYETDRLKPDRKDAKIVCCSVSNGDTTIAYPWFGRCVEATKKLLRSDLPKVGANVKFEHRWTLAKLGCSPKNVVFDTMLAAHVLDNRPGISGLKFQSIVTLGAPGWNDHLKDELDSDEGGGNSKNNIHKIDLKSLLTYCGVDSLQELEIAKIQMKRIEM